MRNPMSKKEVTKVVRRALMNFHTVWRKKLMTAVSPSMVPKLQQ